MDVTVSNDGSKGIRPGRNGYDVLSLESPTNISLASFGNPTGADIGIDAVIIPDNNTAVYISRSGYTVLEISQPDTPLVAYELAGNPASRRL